MSLDVPAGLRATLGQVDDPTTGPWLDQLPGLAADFLECWALRVDGPPMHGFCAMVVPVRTDDDEPAVLKLSWPHPEARDEHRALTVWDGAGAVRLLAADPDAYVLLLERLDAARDLSTVPLDDALRCVGELLRRLAVPAGDGFTRVAEHAAAWSDEFAAALRQPPGGVPVLLIDHAVGCLPELLGSTPDLLLHTDLHYENVLAADREPWLVIDPKPLAGDTAYEIAPLLWNRWDEATSSADPAAHLCRRADVVAEAAGLDRSRVAGWVVVRETVEALDGAVGGDEQWRDVSVAIAEAFLPRLP